MFKSDCPELQQHVALDFLSILGKLNFCNKWIKWMLKNSKTAFISFSLLCSVYKYHRYILLSFSICYTRCKNHLQDSQYVNCSFAFPTINM